MCNALGVTVDYILANDYDDTSSALDQEILKELKNCTPEKKEQILKIIHILNETD